MSFCSRYHNGSQTQECEMSTDSDPYGTIFGFVQFSTYIFVPTYSVEVDTLKPISFAFSTRVNYSRPSTKWEISHSIWNPLKPVVVGKLFTDSLGSGPKLTLKCIFITLKISEDKLSCLVIHVFLQSLAPWILSTPFFFELLAISFLSPCLLCFSRLIQSVTCLVSILFPSACRPHFPETLQQKIRYTIIIALSVAFFMEMLSNTWCMSFSFCPCISYV